MTNCETRTTRRRKYKDVETRAACSSRLKIGITSFIQITQSIVRSIENLAFLRISEIFKTLLPWTASFKWSLWYQLSTQNLMFYKLHLICFATFRHLAILAIFGCYFGYFLRHPWFFIWLTGLFLKVTYWDAHWLNQNFWHIHPVSKKLLFTRATLWKSQYRVMLHSNRCCMFSRYYTLFLDFHDS